MLALTLLVLAADPLPPPPLMSVEGSAAPRLVDDSPRLVDDSSRLAEDAPRRAGSGPRVRLLGDDAMLTLYRAPRRESARLGLMLSVPTGSTPLCGSPCGEVVDLELGNAFVVGGDGMPASSVFSLDPDAQELELEVSGGSKTLQMVGAGLTYLGGGVLTLGLLYLFEILLIDGMTIAMGGAPVPELAPLRIASLGLMGSGLVLGGAGVGIMLGGRTDVTVRR